MSTKSFSAKLAISAGSGVLAFTPATGAAAPVIVDDRPLSISFDYLSGSAGGSSVPWDVDGDGTGDVSLVVSRNIFSSNTTNGRFIYQRFGYLGLPYDFGTDPVDFARSYARGRLVRFDRSDTVTGYAVNAAYSHQHSGNGIETSRRYSRTASGATLSASNGFLGGLRFGVNVFGFGLDIGGEQHLGWGVMRLEPGPNYRLIISKWAYESEPDTPIHVDEVPAPSSSIAALTLLGLGAAGLRQARKRKIAASL